MSNRYRLSGTLGDFLMNRVLLLFGLWIAIQSYAMAQEKRKIEVTAKYIESHHGKIIAKDGVVVYYQDAILKADYLSFDKAKKELILDGHVESLGYKGSKESASHMKIFTDSNEVHFEKLFFISKNDVWLYTQSATQKDGNYTLGASMLSSCEIEDPLWKMYFSQAHYNSHTRYLTLEDTKVYFNDIPIFYTPYLGFSTNQQRTSGLLFPFLGYTKEEGILYEQPIYWAIAPNMDWEFNPQVRLKRNVGIYGTFRFVDSNHSKGSVRLGYFQDFTSYQEAEDTLHLKHYGLEVMYDTSLLFSSYMPQNWVDGLYVNTTLLNDIDYLNLQKTHLDHFGLTPLQESRINYFAQNENYYVGINAKYFIDTRKEHNDDTIQLLPTLELHRYLDTLLFQQLTYSVDIQSKNLYRKTGLRLKQVEAQLPLQWNQSFFDDFLSISLEETLYYSKYFFDNGIVEYDDFSYYSNIHTLRLFTDLTRNYQTFTHVLQPSLAYIYPGDESQTPQPFDALAPEQQELFAVGLPEKHFLLSLNHYLYNEEMELIFYQRLSQSYYTHRAYEWGDFHNEMQYNFGHWSLYSDFVYAPQYKKIRNASTLLSLKEEQYSVSVGHTYKKLLPDEEERQESDDIEFIFSYDINKHYTLKGELLYDIDTHSSKQWQIGGGYHQDCWRMDFYLKQDVTPRPEGYTTDSSFYVQFNFVPFGGAGSIE